MKRKRLPLSILLLILPASCFADGQDGLGYFVMSATAIFISGLLLLFLILQLVLVTLFKKSNYNLTYLIFSISLLAIFVPFQEHLWIAITELTFMLYVLILVFVVVISLSTFTCLISKNTFQIDGYLQESLSFKLYTIFSTTGTKRSF